MLVEVFYWRRIIVHSMMSLTSSLLSIYIVVLNISRSCNGLSSPKWSHNIVVLCNGNEAFHNKTEPLKDANIMFNLTYLNGKNDSLTFYKTGTTLNDFIEKYDVSLFIYDNRHFAGYSLIDILAGHLEIPVIKWFNDGLNLFPQVNQCNYTSIKLNNSS